MRKAKLILTVLAMSAAFSSTALAGTWQPQDNGQWKYQNDDGSFATGWIEESGKSYYLNADGIMLSNTIGTYSGTVLFKHKNAYSFFEIICDGSWSITPQ